uniref:RNase H type-1 domain-containing protein n=1 Tax=Nelumbo nucifera TaxID=4432 RepID=A0A822ZSX8_NELNU|nr:TPA_asm: hypothetical protein HUJ06_003198 [Nelumbo nucifera]
MWEAHNKKFHLNKDVNPISLVDKANEIIVDSCLTLCQDKLKALSLSPITENRYLVFTNGSYDQHVDNVGIGFVIKKSDDRQIIAAQGSAYRAIDSYDAELRAVIRGLEATIALQCQSVRVFLDVEVIVKKLSLLVMEHTWIDQLHFGRILHLQSRVDGYTSCWKLCW